MTPEPRVITRRILVEIGTEEIPANYLFYADANGQAYLRERLLAAFDEINPHGAYRAGAVEIFLTPRRMIFHVPALEFSPKEIHETVVGPPADKAFAEDGSPTPMLAGFAKAKGIDLKKIVCKEVGGKKVAAFEKRVRPEPIEKKIGKWMELFLGKLSFPKNMRWDASGAVFPRPIRTILCLADSRCVKLSLAGIASSRRVRVFKDGRRRLLSARNPEHYFQLLTESGVVWDPTRRREMIRAGVEKATLKAGGNLADQEGLLEEVVFLSESPVVVSGSFDAAFADLPPAVLKASLAKAQRLFSVFDSQGIQQPHFVAVLDGASGDNPRAVQTIAAILAAKLQDSRFFFTEDLKIYSDAAGDDEGAGRLE
ncbi:MAG: glycine--tRNA ligase subunit beta, partial [Candidatus Omnitrophica bacterium]|nr:glycine--tRNA ligase subunit beta [Candidatus Omnitrophota bacterium]